MVVLGVFKVFPAIFQGYHGFSEGFKVQVISGVFNKIVGGFTRVSDLLRGFRGITGSLWGFSEFQGVSGSFRKVSSAREFQDAEFSLALLERF